MNFKLLILLLALGITWAQDDVKCKTDDDCKYLYYICSPVIGECVHKEVMPLSWNEIVGTIVLFVVLAVSSAAGIGGGGIVIPVCLVYFRFV